MLIVIAHSDKNNEEEARNECGTEKKTNEFECVKLAV
jgi:hypothetical protein